MRYSSMDPGTTLECPCNFKFRKPLLKAGRFYWEIILLQSGLFIS
jgi:hypothetical protein